MNGMSEVQDKKICKMKEVGHFGVNHRTRFSLIERLDCSPTNHGAPLAIVLLGTIVAVHPQYARQWQTMVALGKVAQFG
jgi:hypothetical protein